MRTLSVVIPAYNEAKAIGNVVENARTVMGRANIEAEIIVVVDGATDNTAEVAAEVADRVITHPQNMGYGRSLKTGILAAKHDLIAITDADGTYPVERIPEMIELSDQFHMVVGARTGSFYQGGPVKRIGRMVFRRLSEFAAGQHIPDINSGLRVFRRGQIVPFFSVISAGFSFTTTSTLVYLLNDKFVHYIPIEYHKREGKSKVRHIRDSLRALQIIVEAILRCNPIKIFLLLSFPFFLASIFMAMIAIIVRDNSWLLASMVSLCTSGIVMGIGFHGVTAMGRRRMVDDSRLDIAHIEYQPHSATAPDTTEDSADSATAGEPDELDQRGADDDS